MNTPVSQSESAGWFNQLVRISIRLFFAFIIGLALGAGIYFGVNALFTKILQSIQANSQQIDSLETRLQLVEDQLVQRNSTLTSRLQVLEVSSDQQKANLDELQGRVDRMGTDQAELLETATSELNTILDEAVNDQASVLRDIGNLNADLKSLRSEMNTLERDLDSLQAEVGSFEKTSTSSEERIQLMETEWINYVAGFSSIETKLQLFKAIELFTRSRYHLVQNNLGLAQQDIMSAYEVLQKIEPDIPNYQAEAFGEILARVDSALKNLPQKPVAAADDVDSAWNLLLQGLPDTPLDDGAAESTPTPTP